LNGAFEAHDLLGELMLDGYEIQDPWLKGQFQKATEKGLAEGKAEGIAEGLRLALRDSLAELAVEPAEGVIEAADATQLRGWLLQLIHGDVPAALRAR
jgi:hypothetical protein